MRVAFVSMWTAFHGGTEARRRTRRTAELLADRGHEPVVLCSQWWEGSTVAFEREGVTYRALTRAPQPWVFAAKLPLALARVDPTVVQSVARPPAHAAVARVCGRLGGAPAVVDWWDDDPGDWRAADRADATVVPSRLAERRLRERGADADRIRVVPESIDFSLVRSAPVDERADLVYARDLDGDDNVEAFLLALAELRDHDWRATVIGDGPGRERAERTARDLRIADRVEFLGAIPVEERVAVLKGARAFAQTAYRETFATDLLWALACGCVGIVQYQAGSSAHELVENCDRGALVSDPEELAAGIVAAADRERRTVNEAFERYDHEAVLDRYLDCYRSLGV